jgi:integrase/recombinase XerD
MKDAFQSRLAHDLVRFVEFKRALGFSYLRNVFTLRSFDRYVAAHSRRQGRLPLERLLRDWLSRIHGRKAITVAMDLAALREFFRFRRRSDPAGFIPGREWAPQSVESCFVPHVLTPRDVKSVLKAADELPGDRFRALTFKTVILVLYCTGLRPGEAARLNISDVDLWQLTFTIRESKGKTRLVPFRKDLGRVIVRYLKARSRVASKEPAMFIRADGRGYPTRAVCDLIRNLLRKIGLKPSRGRAGPRPFDFRHTFATHRLTRWYRAGADLHARLPWLSAYMGHDDLLGTETYLTATPELLATAGRRFRDRVRP